MQKAQIRYEFQGTVYEGEGFSDSAGKTIVYDFPSGPHNILSIEIGGTKIIDNELSNTEKRVLESLRNLYINGSWPCVIYEGQKWMKVWSNESSDESSKLETELDIRRDDFDKILAKLCRSGYLRSKPIPTLGHELAICFD